MKNVFATAILLVFANVAISQVPSFEKVVHDYGTVSEAEGDITYEFKLTNTGDKPLLIQRVNASCGCTTPGWTKEPIAPNESGFVKATYGAKGRVGAFDKSLTVTTNGSPANITLRIRGNVVAKPIDLRADFPQNIGLLRVKKITDVDLLPGKGMEQVFEVANAETSAINIVIENVPSHLLVTAEPSNLNPNQKGIIRFKTNPVGAKTYGFKSGQATIKVGADKKTIQVNSVLVQDFSSLRSADIVMAPKLVIDQRNIDLGTVKKSSPFNKVIELKNNGQNELVVSGVSSSEKTFTPITKPFRVKEGKTNSLKVTGKVSDKVGKQTIPVYIATNDPSNPLVEVTLSMVVE